jgi:hypothetical protein
MQFSTEYKLAYAEYTLWADLHSMTLALSLPA